MKGNYSIPRGRGPAFALPTFAMTTLPRLLAFQASISIATLTLASGTGFAITTIQKHGQNQGGQHGGNSGGGSPAPAPAPAPRPAPTPAPAPSVNPSGNSGGGGISVSRNPSSPPPQPSRNPAPPIVNNPPVINNPPVTNNRPPVVDRTPQPNFPNTNNRPEPGGRSPVARPEPPVSSSPPSSGHNYNNPSDNYNPPPSRGPSNGGFNRPTDNTPPITSAPPITSHPDANDRPGYNSPNNDDSERRSYPSPSNWKIRYGDQGDTRKNSSPRPAPPTTGPIGSDINNRPGRPNTNNPPAGAPLTGGFGSDDSIRNRYKNPTPRPNSGVPITNNPSGAAERKPVDRKHSNDVGRPSEVNTTHPKGNKGSVEAEPKNAPRVRHNRAEQIAKVDPKTTEVLQKTLTKAGKAKSTSKASKAFVSGLFSGGVNAAACLGASSAAGANFSWYNYLNYGYGGYGGAFYPIGGCFNSYWNCHSYFSFQLGFGSSWSAAGLAFFVGSPNFWYYPAAYCGSYYSSYYGNWGHGYPYYSYPHHSYPYYSYPYYPDYSAYYYNPPVVYQTEYIYYPEVHETTVYVPYEVEKKYYDPNPPAEQPREPVAETSSAPTPPRLPKTSPPSPTVMLADRYISLGDIYFRLGHYDRAVESYQKALSQDPSDANLHFILSDALFAVANYHDAAAEILTAIQLDPGLAESNADKREFYGIPADYNQHIASLEQYINENSADADAWLVLGYNQYFKKEYKLARVAFDKARELASPSTRRGAELFLAVVDVRLAQAAAEKK